MDDIESVRAAQAAWARLRKIGPCRGCGEHNRTVWGCVIADHPALPADCAAWLCPECAEIARANVGFQALVSHAVFGRTTVLRMFGPLVMVDAPRSSTQ